MEKTATVWFDGQTLRPEGVIDMEANKRYVIKFEVDQSSPFEKKEEDAWDVLDRMAGTVEGPGDWSVQHDHYLYGTPKRDETTE